MKYQAVTEFFCATAVTLLLSVSMANAFVAHPKSWSNRCAGSGQRSSALSGVLEFVEPETGVTVRLIGSMHYNPASIQLTADSIRELQADGRLGSVLIESCPSRWNTTLNNDLPEFVTNLLMSEMRMAHDLALEFGRPVILGDQEIEVTVDRMKQSIGETARGLISPQQWKGLAANLTEAWSTAVPSGPQYLGATALLNPKLLLAAPVSFFKYPLSYIVKDPVTAVLVLGFIFGTDAASAAALSQPTTVLDQTVQVFLNPSAYDYSLTDAAVDFLGSVLELILFGRLFLQVLLVERNQILARNILQQCRYYQSSSPPSRQKKQSVLDWMSSLGQRLRLGSATASIPYAESSPAPSKLKGKNDAVVVAVLGMAHVNGIRKLLEEGAVRE